MNKLRDILHGAEFVHHWLLWSVLIAVLSGAGLLMVVGNRAQTVVATNVSCKVIDFNYLQDSKITVALDCDHDGATVKSAIGGSVFVGKVLRFNRTTVVCKFLYQDDSVSGCSVD